jgi:hypothetical protein
LVSHWQIKCHFLFEFSMPFSSHMLHWCCEWNWPSKHWHLKNKPEPRSPSWH